MSSPSLSVVQFVAQDKTLQLPADKTGSIEEIPVPTIDVKRDNGCPGLLNELDYRRLPGAVVDHKPPIAEF
jgi:hypothetical protein